MLPCGCLSKAAVLRSLRSVAVCRLGNSYFNPAPAYAGLPPPIPPPRRVAGGGGWWASLSPVPSGFFDDHLRPPPGVQCSRLSLVFAGPREGLTAALYSESPYQSKPPGMASASRSPPAARSRAIERASCHSGLRQLRPPVSVVVVRLCGYAAMTPMSSFRVIQTSSPGRRDAATPP